MNQSLEVCGGLICIDITCEEKIHKHGGRDSEWDSGFRKRLAKHACNLDIALPISVRAAATRSVIYPMLEMGWASHLSKHISVGFTMIVGISLKLHTYVHVWINSLVHDILKLTYVVIFGWLFPYS